MCKTGKIEYSKKEAATQINLLRKGRKTADKAPVRYYHCPECNHWHMTSVEQGQGGVKKYYKPLQMVNKWKQLIQQDNG